MIHITQMSEPVGLDWLAALEGGYIRDAYPDGNVPPVWTIGPGLTVIKGRKVRKGDQLSEDGCREAYKWEVAEREAKVDSLTRDDLTQAQFDCLVSFAFNIGLGAYACSTCRTLIEMGAPTSQIVDQMRRWNKKTVDGRLVLDRGLVNRRNAEAILWSTGRYVLQDGREFKA